MVAASQADAADVCRGVGAAIAFLAAKGLSGPASFTIEAVAELPEAIGHGASGCFLQSSNRAYVLTYDAFRKKGEWFGVPVSRELYASLSAHEAAHAIAARHYQVAEPSIQAKEYIAYVTMFSTMAPKLRSQALDAFPGTGFADVDRVSSFVYQFDPLRFGANAYRHFLSLQDGKTFLADVLAGRVFAE